MDYSVPPSAELSEFDVAIREKLYNPEEFEEMKSKAALAFVEGLSRVTAEYCWSKYMAGKKEHGGITPGVLRSMQLKDYIAEEVADLVNYAEFQLQQDLLTHPFYDKTN